MDAPEVTVVTSRNVCCDGGGGALGHPKVFYTIGVEGWVDCGYCDRRFVLAGTPAAAQAEKAKAGDAQAQAGS